LILVAVLSTIGVNVPINTMTTLGSSPIPINIITRGNQAMGGIGLINSKSVPNVDSNNLFHPIKIPKGIPMPQEKQRAIRTRLKLAQTCPQIY